MNLKAIIATTLPMKGQVKFGIVGLQQLQYECRELPFVYQGKLYTIVDSEIIRLAVARPTLDEWALMVELNPVEDSTVVMAQCNNCGSMSSMVPEEVTIFGVNLKGAMENSAFIGALIKLMDAQGRDLHLESLIKRGKNHGGCTGRESHHDGVQ